MLMQIYTRILVSSLILFFLFFIITRIKKGSIDFKYALIWISINLSLLIFTLFPSLISSLAELFGIGVPLNLLLFIGIMICLFMTFCLAMSFSKLKKMSYLLTQQIALLDKAIIDCDSKKIFSEGS